MISMNSQQLNAIVKPLEDMSASFIFTGVEIDSRKDCNDALFVAIGGENFDGHDFVRQAVDKGAVAAIVERRLDISIPQLLVEDAKKTLGALARAWRKQLQPVVIAITGSNGKTTVKEMLGQILSSQQHTLKTEGNLNNDIGVPLTLFQLSQQHRFAVIEMGANHSDEIRQLMAIAEPDVVYVNNARAAHVEGFGSLEAVVRAKGEMYQYCSQQAVAVFNDDEEAVKYWKSICATQNQLDFSTAHNASVNAGSKRTDKGLALTLSYQGQQGQSEIYVQGEHNVQNALAAISLALACGLSLSQATAGLDNFSGVKGRQAFIQGVKGSLIMDDSYNANPDSLAAAVKVLCDLKGTPWLALGDMAELGANSLALHLDAVAEARDAGVEQFFALGEMSCQSASVFGDSGFCFNRHAEMAEFLKQRLNSNVNLLIKGSRSAHMDKLVDALIIKDLHSTLLGGQHVI